MLAAQLLLLGKARQGLVRDVRSAFFERLAHQSLGWHPDRRAGDLATRVISDVDAIESSMLRDLSDLLEDALTFLIGGGIVIALQPVTRLAQAKTAASPSPAAARSGPTFPSTGDIRASARCRAARRRRFRSMAILWSSADSGPRGTAPC